MASWSQRRKLTISSVIIIILVVAVSFFAYEIFYVPPSCSDGKMNGSETGVDCGGTCQKLCLNAFKEPNVSWTRMEQIAPGLYNVAAYVINPNSNAGAQKVPYHVTLYDNNVTEVTSYDGFLTLPTHRNTLAFNGAVSVNDRTPVKALFQFSSPPDWNVQPDLLSNIIVVDKKYTETLSGSTLSVVLKNNSVYPIGKMSVYVVLYDKDNNALGFSKTIIDGIDGNSSVTAPFTWPINRNGKVISIEVLPVAE